MNAQAAYDRIEHSGLMAGMRGHFPPDVALKHVDVLLSAGQIDVFEFTMNSDRPIEAMQAAKKRYGDDISAGMGTVLDAEMAKRVLDAGADFIIAPSFNREVIALAQQRDVLVVPGVITPTECVDAWATGVKLLKIFPIGSMGLDYFKAVRGPLNHIKFICNGGMTDQNSADYLKAGAIACGMAGWMTGDGSMPMETLAHRARTMREIVTSLRTKQPIPTHV
jgi:2-dehydro-3-deoxyphosphogluconate aldolase/(4S)-4-hydroxy-2-oxoglutarate aldolase